MRALINLIKTLKGAERQPSNAAGEERTNGGASWIQCAWADSEALRFVGDIVKTFGEYSEATASRWFAPPTVCATQP